MKPEETTGQAERQTLDNRQLQERAQQRQALDFRDGVYQFNQTFEALLEAYARDPERWDGLE
jgi:hypothetical protein